MSGNPAIIVDAGGLIASRILDYAAKHTPSEQERRGDRRLDETRSLIVEHQLVIHSSDLELIEDKMTHARDIKHGLDSKSGLSRFLHAREYRKAAKSAYHYAKTASDRGRDGVFFAAQRPDTSSVPEISDCDRATGVALSLCRVYLSCKNAFPTSEMKYDWAATVWREACAKAGADLDLFAPYELFADGNMKLFTETKKRIMHAVETLYGFDTSHAANSISKNTTLAQALLSGMAFIYRELNPDGGSHPYRHPVLQKAINLTWFRNKDDNGVVFHEHFSPLPVQAIAFILAVIECCIDEWTDGTRKETTWDGEKFKTVYQSHINSLNDLQQHGLAQGADLFEHIRSDLLKEARKHAGVPPVPVTEFRRLSPDALEAAHREDLPAYPVPAINIVSGDSEA